MRDPRWTDEPLISMEADTLDRAAYARQAAELIRAQHSFDSSAVFGLSGDWGSGKTSLINMVVQHLTDTDDEWAIARFSPWATSDVTGLLGEFYSSLSQALPKKKRRHVTRALAVTAGVAAPAANLIPYAGGPASEAVKRLGRALTKSPPWDTAFEKASVEIKKLRIPILVVVDDIDRLHVEELMALLRVVRLLGRFDGVQYLLAYDDQTVSHGLSAADAISGDDGTAERFMEKIVQYPLIVPPLLQHQKIARLNSGLHNVSRGGSSTDDGRISALMDDFLSLLRTPRAIDRYLAQVRYHLPLVPVGEIDDGDVLILTLVRVSFPHLFNAIPLYRRQLIDGHTGELAVRAPAMELEPFDAKDLIARAPAEYSAVARRLLTSLFPNIREKGQISVNSSSSRRGVTNEEYFDRYFAMGIPANDVKDADVKDAVADAAEGDSIRLITLLGNEPEERRLLVLSKATSPDNQPETDRRRLRLAEALTQIANTLPSRDGSPFSSQDQTLRWIARLLVVLDPATSPDAVLALLARLNASVLRIRTWRGVEYELERVPAPEVPGWYATTGETLVDEAVDGFIDHLRAGDDATTEVGVGYQLHFALRNGRTAELKSKIATLIDSGNVDVSTLASRLVSARTYAGVKTDWQLSSDFDQHTYDQIAPPGDDPWIRRSYRRDRRRPRPQLGQPSPIRCRSGQGPAAR
jgi:hypothetical protein